METVTFKLFFQKYFFKIHSILDSREKLNRKKMLRPRERMFQFQTEKYITQKGNA